MQTPCSQKTLVDGHDNGESPCARVTDLRESLVSLQWYTAAHSTTSVTGADNDAARAECRKHRCRLSSRGSTFESKPAGERSTATVLCRLLRCSPMRR